MVRKPAAARKGLPIDDTSSSVEQETLERTTRSTTENARNKSRKQKAPKKKQDLYSEMIRLQNTVQNIIPRAPFGRLLKEIFQQFGDYRITKHAFDAIQEAAEIFIVCLLNDAYKLTLHRQRVTLNNYDIQLVIYLRGPQDLGARS